MKRLLTHERAEYARVCAICDEMPQVDSLCWQHALLRLERQAVLDGSKSDWPPLQLGKHPKPVSHQREMLDRSHGRTAWIVELTVLLSEKDVLLDTTGRDSDGDYSLNRRETEQ